MSCNLLIPKEDFQEETLAKVLERYSGFGKNFYRLLEEKLPQVFSKLTFYQETSYQMRDSYAVYDDVDKSFAIQLDPDIEVIVIWNQYIQTEIGSWVDKPEEEAIIFIQDEFLGSL
jgi:hypothetical protein